MPWVKLVDPSLNVSEKAGLCLTLARKVFGAPAGIESALESWQRAKYKHTDDIPAVPVPVYFDHWGTYDGRYKNWGHVVAWIPGRGYLSSPTSGKGAIWLPSIRAVEQKFNAKYLGWSEDINGKRVAQWKSEPLKEVIEMVDMQGLSVLYRFYLGKAPTEYGIKNRLGKQTFAQAQKEIMESDDYKKLLKARQESQAGFSEHLPEALRAVVKLPEQVRE